MYKKHALCTIRTRALSLQKFFRLPLEIASPKLWRIMYIYTILDSHKSCGAICKKSNAKHQTLPYIYTYIYTPLSIFRVYPYTPGEAVAALSRDGETNEFLSR